MHLAAGSVEIEHEVEGDINAVRHVWPMLASDGATPSAITVRDRTATVARGGGRLEFEALTDGASVSRLGVAEPCRNGEMEICVAEAAGRTIRSRIRAYR